MIYALSDFHLSLGGDKPMEVFGGNWENHAEKIKQSCGKLTKYDTLLITGDVSWATYLETAIPDFAFLDELLPRKIISKGNHDYWWETLSKQYKFLEKNNFTNIDFLHNNSYTIEDYAICGTKGATKADEEKIYNRELERLKISLNSAPKESKKIVMLHYPPDENFRAMLEEANVESCVYGHLHNDCNNILNKEINGIKYYLTSCDYLDFKPIRIS